MKNIFKKGDEKNINYALKLHKDLIKEFKKQYGSIILVHSTPKSSSFKKIIKEGKLKLPSEHGLGKKAPYIEKLIGIENYIYYSLGFAYATRYDFKYSLLFDLKYLKESEYYKSSLVFKCCKSIADYFDQNDPKELKKLANKNKACKKVVDIYYNQKYLGKTKQIFKFWRIEKEFYETVQSYKNKNILLKIIKKTRRELLTKYPQSIRDAKKDYLSGRIQEILSRKEVNLQTSPYFLGFYIKGEIPKDIKKVLDKNYKGKLIFDGKIVKRI